MIINRKSPSVFILENPRFQFFPGNNIIPENIEQTLIENKYHKELIQSGVHTIQSKSRKKVDVKKDDSEKNDDPVNEILNLNVNTAKKVISELLNKTILEEILERDKRTGIQKLVNEQLEKIKLTEDDLKEGE